MSEQTLREQFDLLRREQSAALEHLEHELQTAQAECDTLWSELQSLQGRYEAALARFNKFEIERDYHATALPGTELEVAKRALERSYLEFVQKHDYWIALESANRQIADLFRSDADLQKALSDYQIFEQHRHEIAGLPLPHQQAALDVQKRLQARIAPYLKLLAQHNELRRERQITLQVIVARKPVDNLIHWAVPLLRDKDRLPQDLREIFTQLLDTLLDLLIGLSREQDWTFDKIEVGEWSGYGCLRATAEYCGDGSLLDAIEQFLQQGLKRFPLFQEEVVSVRVAEMSWRAWQLGEQVIEHGGMTALPATVQPQQMLHVAQHHDWYSDEDLKSWNRPLKTAGDSLWNVQGRRLRTLLMRMIAKGKIGHATVTSEDLWTSLPEPHLQSMQDGIARLIEKDVFISGEDTSGESRSVGVNPALLVEIQNLITREVTDFWVDIIGTQVPPVIPNALPSE